ncbi:MAG TPA: O-antigen ligase family protein [Chitinophagaceae bacterium]|nr:O-antigen ligase family protein [Chitinophagaceae bacterium]
MIASVNKSNIFFALLAVMFISFVAVSFLTENYYLLAAPFAVLFLYAGWQNKELVFFLLLFTLPLSFEYHFSSTLGTDIPDELLMLFVSGLFIAYWFYFPGAISKKTLLHPLILLLLILFGWILITVIFSTHPLLSLKFLLAKTWYAGAFVLAPLILFRQKKLITAAAILITGAMMIVAIIALMRHKENGFSFATINDAVYPLFRNHVNYSAMLVCIIPVLFAFFRQSKKGDEKFIIAVLIIIALAALFFSYSRGAWLALLIGFAAYWLIKKRLLVYTYVAAVMLAAIALFWIKNNDRYLQYAPDFKTTIFHKNFAEHLVATYRLKDVSTEERFYRWIAGIRMIKDNWLTGYGPNTFYDNYKGYAVPAFKTWVSDNKDHSTVHNYFLLTAIEQGIPGLIFLLIILGAMLFYAQYLYHRAKDSFYKATAITIGVIITMITMLIFLSDLIETDKIGSLFFLCLATLVATDINIKRKSNSSPDIQRIP